MKTTKINLDFHGFDTLSSQFSKVLSELSNVDLYKFFKF